MGLARLLAQKLRWTAAYAESIAQFDAAGRLLHIILLHNERYGEELEPGMKYTLDLGLNQADLASMVGARREWVNRILNEWRRRGLLSFDNGAITILDLHARHRRARQPDRGPERWRRMVREAAHKPPR